MSRLHSCEPCDFWYFTFCSFGCRYSGILAGMTRAHLRTTVSDEPQKNDAKNLKKNPRGGRAASSLEACETERPVPENHTSTYLRYIRVLGGYTERRCVHSLVKSVVLTFTLPS